MTIFASLVRRVAAALLLGLPALAPLPGAAAPAPPVPPWTAELGHDHPLAGRIWLPAEKRFISVDELVARAAKARWVLLGEKHDDPDHHALQAYMLRRLIGAGRRPVVAFEQFESDKTPAIADYLRAHPRDAAGLGAATGWEKSGWPDWRQYDPIAQAALDAGLPLVAANIPAAEARAMARREAVEPERVTELSLDQPLPRDQYAALLDDIRRSHCGMLPEHAVASMAMAQRARDGGMASALVTAARNGPRDGGVLITGNGHARIDRGVPVVLGRLAPEASTFSLAFLEVEDGNTDPADYGPPADAVWFTARTDGEDPCARMTAHLRKKP